MTDQPLRYEQCTPDEREGMLDRLLTQRLRDRKRRCAPRGPCAGSDAAEHEQSERAKRGTRFEQEEVERRGQSGEGREDPIEPARCEETEPESGRRTDRRERDATGKDLALSAGITRSLRAQKILLIERWSVHERRAHAVL